MNKKIIAPLILTSALFASLIPVHPTYAKYDDSKALTKLQKVSSKNDVKNILKSLPGSKAIKKNYKQYEVVSVEKDAAGFTHYTLEPKSNGRKAINTEVKVHVNPKGQVTFVNGDLDQKAIAPTNVPTIPRTAAIDNAFKAAGVTASEVKNIADLPVVNKAELAINAETNKYVYDVQLIYILPTAANWNIQIDAETGAVVKKQNELTDVATKGTGIGLNGYSKTINLNLENSTYYLTDLTHTGAIGTYDANNGTTNVNLMTDTDQYFTSLKQRAGVDAHFNAGQVYDYYKNVHNRDSFDGKGAPIYSVVHYGSNYNNAFWNGQVMIYGDGDGTTFGSLARANDVAAHELTHAVTANTANFVYANQSGALNESFSDVFAYFVDPDFTIAEDVYTPNTAGDALRSIANPALYGQPAHMNQYQYLPNTASGDFGGVHANSGIPNKAFYNTVTKIGKAKSEKIYYRALTLYLTPNSTFADAKAALVQSANDLYGATDAATVANAWNLVGVTQ